MSSVVLDASALLALLQQEPGAEVVAAALKEVVAAALKNSCVSMVNWSEVLQKALARHIDTEDI